jgi:3-deoxy-D-manno-octulosonic-acid transferase
MMLSLYNVLSSIGIFLYAPWILFKKGPEDKSAFIRERYGMSEYHQCDIWVHAVSVGEVLACLPFLKALKRDYPEKKIVLSTTTYTGQKIALDRFPEADRVMYMPLDAVICTRRVANLLRPEIFITVETELWPALFVALKNAGSRIIILNGRLSQDSFKGYLKIKSVMKQLLSLADYLYMQGDDDAERIMQLGADKGRVGVMGNFKFDIDLDSSDTLSWLENIHGNILLAASTHEGEEAAVLDAYALIRGKGTELKLILAPRHPERFGAVADLISKRGLSFVRRSELQGSELQQSAVSRQPSAITDNKQLTTHDARRTTIPELPDIILLDTIGELSRVFSKVSIAYIGGSLVPKGGQNILEPAFWAKPIMFGPHMENFPFAADFLDKAAAIRVMNAEDIADSVAGLISNEEMASSMGQNAKAIIERNRGAVKRALELVRGFIGTA